jgi:hypothetical protein
MLCLFAIAALVTFAVLVVLKSAYAVSCDTGAQVCNFTISTGVLYNTIYKNGVQSTSIMPNDEDSVKHYVETSDPCGVECWQFFNEVLPTGNFCGTTAWSDCKRWTAKTRPLYKV